MTTNNNNKIYCLVYAITNTTSISKKILQGNIILKCSKIVG